MPLKGTRRVGNSTEIDEEENPNTLLFSDTSYKVGASC
jgi:hypothetical protein